MLFKSGIKLSGELDIIKTNIHTNEIVEKIHVSNLIVTTGKEFVASRMIGTTSNVMSHMAIGASPIPQSIDDTTLKSEIDRVAIFTIDLLGANIEYTAAFSPGGSPRIITEAGIFNDVTTGDMLCRTTFPPITQTTSEAIGISWTISVG